MMGKEVQNSMGNHVAIGKVFKVKRWVHPYMSWTKIKLIEHKKEMGFLFMCCGLWENFQFDAPQCLLLFVCSCFIIIPSI